jgi:inosose dehydratase
MSPVSRVFGRRGFTLGVGAAGLAVLSARRGLGAPKEKGKEKAAPSGISIGYATFPWGDHAQQAIDDVAEAGYPGIQLRLNILKEYATPEALKAALAKGHLTFACLSGGGPKAEAATRAAEIDKFMTGAKFARAAGALMVQATSPSRGSAEKIASADLKAFAETLTELGKRTAEIGLPLAFHNHMGQIGQNPDEVDAILEMSDPKYVKLLLDTGHYAAAGGDPVKAIKTHGKRLGLLHIKDVKDKAPGTPSDTRPGPDGKPPAPDNKKYLFVELGQGKVDFKAVFAALRAVSFKGWVMIELDTTPPGGTPKGSAITNKAFLEKTLGLTV